jgi:Right handed beta helix region
MRRREFLTAATAALLVRKRAQAQTCPAPCTAPTAAEVAAGVTPADASIPPGDPRRYGAALDGVTDDTAAMTNWARVAGQLSFPAARTALISAAIPLSGNTTISASQGASIATATPDISMLTAASQANIRIVGLGFLQTAAGSKAYVAHVDLNACTNCVVEKCDFQGCQWVGVYLRNGCTHCVVRNNRFHDFLGSLQGQSDVCIFQNSSNNIVDGNMLYGGGELGIFCLAPHVAGPLWPQRNQLSNNRIGAHTGYGIAVYMPGFSATFTAGISGALLSVDSVSGGTLAVGQFVRGMAGTPYGYIVSAGSGSGDSGTYNLSLAGSVAAGTPMVASAPTDTFNEVSGNYIENIQGSFATNRASGAGIYVVGAAAGATQVSGNTVSNCCVQTLQRSLAPAGIGVSGILAGCTKPLVAHNSVLAMTQGDGILVVGCESGCDLVANEVQLPAVNNGSGPGGAGLVGTGIRIDGSSRVVCRDNEATVLGAGHALLIYANGVSIGDISIAGGYYESASAVTFRVDASNIRYTISNLTVSGVRARNTGASDQEFSLSSIPVGTGPPADRVALSISNYAGLRLSGQD